MKSATKQVVNLPNNEVMSYYFKSKISASLVLSKKARDAYVFKDIHSACFIYLGQLCNDGCTVVLYKNEFMLSKVLNCFYQEI